MAAASADVEGMLSRLTTGAGSSKSGIRRSRPQLSCVPCRTGKLKCNRVHPVCDQCRKRSKDGACVYLPPPPKINHNQNIKGRLRNLESLVLDLMKDKNSREALRDSSNETSPPSRNGSTGHSWEESPESTSTASRPSDADTHVSSQVEANHRSTSYASSSHWSSILQEIKDVQNVIEDEGEDEYDDEQQHEDDDKGLNTRTSVDITFGNPKHVSKRQLIDMLPEKDEADRLVAQWLSSPDPFIYAIHRPTFAKEYKLFWENPNAMPVMWFGLLYSIMAISILLSHRSTPEGREISPSSLEQADYYHELASSAMALAEPTKPQAYAIECLLIYTESQYIRWEFLHVKVWLMVGTTVRLALRMGYHRDPSHYPSLTPFEGEMRRRHWHLVYQMDVLISFALGLPSMIRTIDSDAQPPKNLLDDDYGPETISLPPERSYDQLTPGLYTIAKSRLTKAFAAATEMTHAIKPPPITDILLMDEEVQRAHEAIPPPLKLKPFHECDGESPDLLMIRFNLYVLYLKCRCVLHRRYLVSPEGISDEQLERCRTICVASALESLGHHASVFQGCQPGGHLHQVRWYLTSVTTYDFLHAAMIVCLEISRRHSLGLMGAQLSPPSHELVAAMQEIQSTWGQVDSQLKEARRASRALKVMVAKVMPLETTTATTKAFVAQQADGSVVDNTAPSSMGDLGSAGDGLQPLQQDITFDEFLSMGNMLDAPMDFDWNTWDNEIRGEQSLFRWPDQFDMT